MSNKNLFAARRHKPFPLFLVLLLKDLGRINTFVETGTYKGDAARLCAKHFSFVLTIEGVKQRWADLAQQDWPYNVTLCVGDSGDELRGYLERLDAPAVLWLEPMLALLPVLPNAGGQFQGRENAMLLVLSSFLYSFDLPFVRPHPFLLRSNFPLPLCGRGGASVAMRG